ncbi:hypothetical protein MAR_027838 [Mya arenaria]|uniref:Uncharacterized protein n=1 Tax=Mya arenaria TaxID=6604 RepID=A0ABY7EYS2_MYAAR|nr:hypothetical protein MAR_027838 [Mya arenaria]
MSLLSRPISILDHLGKDLLAISLPRTTSIVLPEYACAQLAKYDVISRASRDHVFKTNYIMWLDVGYFRDRKSINKFSLSRPNCCNESRVAMNVIHANTHMAMSVTNIFRKNLLWVGGGLVFANRDIILRYETQLKKSRGLVPKQASDEYRSSGCVRVV